MLAKSTHFVSFNAGQLRGSISLAIPLPRPFSLLSFASNHTQTPQSTVFSIFSALLRPTAVSVMSVGSPSRVLQSPLSHRELYGEEHPLIRSNSHSTWRQRSSARSGRVRNTSAKTVGKKASSSRVSICSVTSTHSNGKGKKKSASVFSHPKPTNTGTETSAGIRKGSIGTEVGVTGGGSSTLSCPSVGVSHRQSHKQDRSLPPVVEAESPQTTVRRTDKATSAGPGAVRMKCPGGGRSGNGRVRGEGRSGDGRVRGEGRSGDGRVRGEGRMKGEWRVSEEGREQRVRGAWNGESGSSMRPPHKTISGRISSRTSGEAVLLSETESVCSMGATSHTTVGSHTTTTTTPAAASFSRWPARFAGGGVQSSFPQGLPQRMMSSVAGRGWGRGGQRQLEVGDVGVGLGRMNFRNVIVMSGAGISTPCGIPDFRYT